MNSYPIQCINYTQSLHLSAAALQKCILVSRAGKLTLEITSIVNVELHFLAINPSSVSFRILSISRIRVSRYLDLRDQI